MKNYIYPACFYKQSDGAYVVTFPDFDNVATEGEDIKDAYLMAVDCLGTLIAGKFEDNEKLPQSSAIENVRPAADPELGDDVRVMLVSVDLDDFLSKASVKKTLSIPAWLDKAASEQHINFSRVLQDALKQQLGL